MFPWPLFNDASPTDLNISRPSTSAVPMDSEDQQTAELRMQAQSAINTLLEGSQKNIAQEY
jgi:hypothetical protein